MLQPYLLWRVIMKECTYHQKDKKEKNMYDYEIILLNLFNVPRITNGFTTYHDRSKPLQMILKSIK